MNQREKDMHRRCGLARWGGVVSLVSMLAGGGARAGEVDLDRAFWSEALGRELSYGVYLPDAGDGAELPVLYLLHGYGATHREWVELGRVDRLLDRLIGTGAIAPLIAVMPTADKSWYVDSAARGGPGDYATALRHDLVAHVRQTYPAIDAAEGRAVMGLSMGGFGALVLGLAEPQRFASVVALSPAVFVPGGLSWQRWSLGTTPAERQTWFPGVFGTPFDSALYARAQPSALVAQLVTPPPDILLTSGEDDGFGFELGTVELFLALRRAGVPVDLRIDDGRHDWVYWREAAEAALIWLDQRWSQQP